MAVASVVVARVDVEVRRSTNTARQVCQYGHCITSPIPVPDVIHVRGAKNERATVIKDAVVRCSCPSAFAKATGTKMIASFAGFVLRADAFAIRRQIALIVSIGPLGTECTHCEREGATGEQGCVTGS